MTYRIDAGTMMVLRYENPKEAQQMGNYGCLVSSEDELINGPVLMGTMIELYKRATGSAKANFKDRKEIAKLIWPLLEKLSTMGKTLVKIVETKREFVDPKPTVTGVTVTRGVVMKKPATKTAAVKKTNGTKTSTAKASVAPKAPATASTRAKYAGKKISLGKKTEGKNVRKLTDAAAEKGVGGHASMEIVRKNPGITYEDFIAKGGRRIDLAHDLERGNYELK